MANADYTLMKALVGRYQVLDWNTELKAGNVTIYAEDTGVGFKTEPLQMASHPIPAMEVSTSKNDTVITIDGNKITQKFVNPAGKITHVEYEIEDGFLRLRWNDCANSACRPQSFTLTTGKSPGDALDAKTFLSTLTGSYAIETAGGKPPEGENNVAQVDIESDPEEASFYFPYCLPIGCDLGYIGFKYVSTRVFRRSLGNGHDAYELFRGEGPTLTHYTWESNNGKISLFNYQYSLKPKTVCLEHNVTKKVGP